MVEVKSIFTIQKLFLSFSIFGFALLMPFLSKHLSIAQIATAYLVYFTTPLILILFSKKIKTKNFMFIAIIISYLTLFIFFIKPTMTALIIFYIMWGFLIYLFWVSYNIRYFTFSHSMNRATSAGHFIIVGPILNTFLPLLSILAISLYGYKLIAAIGFIIISINLFKISKLPQLEIPYNFLDAFKKSKGMRSLKFLQGVWEAGSILIPLYTLFFIKEELKFGGFLAYLGLAGVIGTLIITRISDKQNKRLKFFFPILIALAVCTVLLTFSENIIQWMIFTAMFGITSTLAYPFFFAVVLDKIEDKTISMITREFMLNLGRAVGVSSVILLIWIDWPIKYLYIICGLSLLSYLYLLFIKRVYVDEAYHPLSPVVKVYDNSRNLVFKVYGWGKVIHLRELPKKTTTKIFDGAKWITFSIKHIGEVTFNKLIKGKTSSLFRRMKKP